ncbi:hypothetical protein ACI2JA_08015 [Alkalihalobacillus sp. NPDC078783]
MLMVLKSKYKAELIEDELFITNLFNKKQLSINIPADCDPDVVLKKLYLGFRVKTGQGADYDGEERYVISISKSIQSHFLIDDEIACRREANVRGILIRALNSGISINVLEKYREAISQNEVYLLEDNDGLSEELQCEGIQSREVTVEDLTLLSEQDLIIINESSLSNIPKINLRAKCLVYSYDHLRIGPLLIPGVTVCLHCYQKTDGLTKNKCTSPLFYRNFITSFLINTIYFSFNQLHTFLTEDVGLPIRKYYDLNVPDLSIYAKTVYKTQYCDNCFK